MLASVLVNRAGRILSDAGHDRWTEAVLLDYLNAAVQAVIEVDPTASSEVRDFTCAAGTQQTIPAGTVRFLGGVRNLGAGGATPGRAIRTVSIDQKDAYYPDWHSDAESATIRECIYDPDLRDVFYVYPPATNGTHIAIRVLVIPADVTATGDTVPVDDSYSNPLLFWMLNLAFSENTDTGSDARAQAFEQRFYNAMGVKVQGQRPRPDQPAHHRKENT